MSKFPWYVGSICFLATSIKRCFSLHGHLKPFDGFRESLVNWTYYCSKMQSKYTFFFPIRWYNPEVSKFFEIDYLLIFNCCIYLVENLMIWFRLIIYFIFICATMRLVLSYIQFSILTVLCAWNLQSLFILFLLCSRSPSMIFGPFWI